MKAAAVVTGASTGIGLGTVRVLTQRGWHVFGSVRKPADAERLTSEFGSAAFTPLLFDVTDQAAVRAGADRVAEALAGGTLAGLVNNAGVVVPGPLALIEPDEMRRQFEINFIGQLHVTQAFLPLLGSDRSRQGRPGRVINMSSVGGKVGFPYIGPYIASKHALEGFSESLRRELLLYGIDVIIVGPGSVAMPIWDKAEEFDTTPYDDSDYRDSYRKFQKLFVEQGKREGLAPEAVGAVVARALTAKRPKTRYAVVPNPIQNWFLPRWLPVRMVDRTVGKLIGLLPK